MLDKAVTALVALSITAMLASLIGSGITEKIHQIIAALH